MGLKKNNSKSLYEVAKRGDLEKLRTHIDDGGDINWKNPEQVGPNLCSLLLRVCVCRLYVSG